VRFHDTLYAVYGDAEDGGDGDDAEGFTEFARSKKPRPRVKAVRASGGALRPAPSRP
jgi:hypothetical protein